MALALGNFLNHGTRLGRSAGFRLKSLSKMQVWFHLGFQLANEVQRCALQRLADC